MQLFVSPMPGSVAGARAQLAVALDYAGAVSASPNVDTLDNLTSGIAAAKQAASLLFMAEPTSPFQDVVQARRDALEGKQLLERAVSAYGTAQDVDPTPQVKLLASGAFNAFESALAGLAGA